MFGHRSLEEIVSIVPVHRIRSPEDVAGPLLYLTTRYLAHHRPGRVGRRRSNEVLRAAAGI